MPFHVSCLGSEDGATTVHAPAEIIFGNWIPSMPKSSPSPPKIQREVPWCSMSIKVDSNQHCEEVRPDRDKPEFESNHYFAQTSFVSDWAICPCSLMRENLGLIIWLNIHQSPTYQYPLKKFPKVIKCGNGGNFSNCIVFLYTLYSSFSISSIFSGRNYWFKGWNEDFCFLNAPFA